MQKAIVIGRHNGEIPGVAIKEQRSIQFPATSAECKPILAALLDEAYNAKAALIFQALPGQMIAAITSEIGRNGPLSHVPVGVVVSKPGERPSAKRIRIESYGALEALEAVQVANPNAKLEHDDNNDDTAYIVVDPPMKFIFSHIEWL